MTGMEPERIMDLQRMYSVDKSNARNHHYVSQVEQRLNAIDPNVRPGNERIYKFVIVDAENLLIKNLSEDGVKIEKNMAVNDLYTLKMLGAGGQHNLEASFQQYENDIGLITRSLISKLSDPANVDFKLEVLRLYLLKFLNSFRNPYGIKKTLSILKELKGAVPGSESLKEHFMSIDEGIRKQASRVCAEFGVTEEEYLDWLKAIYLLILQPLEGGLNLLENLVKGLVENPNYMKDITVFQYANEHAEAGVLICDRGITEGNVDDGVLVQMFNLNECAFVSFIFADIRSQKLQEFPERYLEGIERLTKETKIHVSTNDVGMLAAYNRHCVWQSFAHVYCAKPRAYGVSVVD
ncbi:DUF4238 domain-containing protein [Pseudomonas viridiflava]|uniref:DUF4238 domain-containing protein n=1 Tax=Pseudomonas viridiflava TaxID=33069 RepID=UPI0013CE5AB0|nr:DUF4238 domain-containing protein [Pseudomonas viridiflava]